MRKVLLGLTGSVASVLYVKLVNSLQKIGDVATVLTPRAEHFVSDEFNGIKVYREWQEWHWFHSDTPGKGPFFNHDDHMESKWRKDDPVLHIELRDKYSALVIAPCSANTLAKLANGLCDNLLTSVARAWDQNRPVIIAPAMNTHMWNHPITEQHIQTLRKWGYKIVMPQEKMLACNTYGMGAMANIEDIVKATAESLRWSFPLPGRYPWEKQYCHGIPVGCHPGAFNAKRKNSTHTGVDLYCEVGTPVVPVENGVVVAVEPFTGPKDNSPWWLDTDCVLVEGATGVICYGEIQPCVRVGDKVCRGDTRIGEVLRVIPPDRPQHPELQGWKPSMLHIEMYPHGYYKPSDGYGKSIHYLQDPTQYLKEAYNAPEKEFKKE